MSDVGQWVLLVAKGDILCIVYEKVRRSYIFSKNNYTCPFRAVVFLPQRNKEFQYTLSLTSYSIFFQCFFQKKFMVLLKYLFFNWRKIALKCCVVSAVQQ